MHMPHLIKDKIFFQSGLKEYFFNSLHDKQIDHPHMYFKKSHDSLKISSD